MGGKKGKKKSKKKKSYTKAQKMAKARIAAGKTISSVKASNKQKVKDAAAARHAKFKQTKVQTFGGKKTSFSSAEKKRITDAGYKVAGYSKAKPNVGAGTEAMVAADNAQYGTSFPEGSIGISEEGKRIAEQNRAEAAAKKAAEAAAAKKAEAARVAAAKKEATRKSTFDSSRIFSDKAFNQYMQSGGIRGINMSVFNNPNNYLNKGMNERIKNEQFARFGDPFSTFRKNPNPNTLFGDDALQVGKSDKTYAAGGRGNPFGRPDQAFNPFRSAEKGGPGSGPTPLTRETIKRFGPTALSVGSSFLPGYSIGSKLFNEGRSDSALTKSLNNVDNINVGGLSIGFNSPENTDIGARVGRFFTSLPGKVADAFTGGDDTKVASAGGLNISSGGVDSGEAEGSKTGRTLTARFNKPGLDTLAGGLDFATNDRFDFDNLGKGLFGYGAVTPSNVINDAMSIAQNKNLTVKDMGTFLNTVKDVSTSDDKLGTVKNILSNQDTTGRLLGPVYNQLRDSEIVDSLATKKLGLPDNYGEQLDQTKGALETAYNKLGTDDKANRRIISDLFIGKDPNLNLLKRGAEQFTNESGTIANYQDKTNLAKFQDSFKENSPLFKGLNRDERGLMGGLGNWRLSNLGTKIVGQNLEGTNNIADLASNIIDTAGTNKATQSFLKTVKGGAPTPQSIIGGALPKFGGRSGGSGSMNRLRSSTGSNATTLAAATPTSVEEVLPLPTTATQTGTDSGNLASIMQNAYQNQMSLYGMNPNYSANFRQPRFNRPRKRFRQVFNRGYF